MNVVLHIFGRNGVLVASFVTTEARSINIGRLLNANRVRWSASALEVGAR